MKVTVSRIKHMLLLHKDAESVVPPSNKFPYWMVKDKNDSGEERATFYCMYDVQSFIIEGEEDIHGLRNN